jgi:hypothetical protein
MTLNIIFFDDYEECVYSCDGHMPAGMDDLTTEDPACLQCPVEQDWQLCGLGANGLVEGARTCSEEELPGKTAWIISMMIIIPIYMIVSRMVRPLLSFE